MIVYRVTLKDTGEESHFRKIKDIANAYPGKDISTSTLYKRLTESNSHENKFLLVEKLIIK